MKGDLLTAPIELQHIKVGDIIRIKDGQLIPADCILIKIENPNKECFVKTVALDGERNLKPKVASRYLQQNFEKMFDPLKYNTSAVMQIETMKPTKDLYVYKGKAKFNL